MYKTNLHLLVSQKQFKGECLLIDPGGPFYKMKTSFILHQFTIYLTKCLPLSKSLCLLFELALSAKLRPCLFHVSWCEENL